MWLQDPPTHERATHAFPEAVQMSTSGTSIFHTPLLANSQEMQPRRPERFHDALPKDCPGGVAEGLGARDARASHTVTDCGVNGENPEDGPLGATRGPGACESQAAGAKNPSVTPVMVTDPLRGLLDGPEALMDQGASQGGDTHVELQQHVTETWVMTPNGRTRVDIPGDSLLSTDEMQSFSRVSAVLPVALSFPSPLSSFPPWLPFPAVLFGIRSFQQLFKT